MSKNYALIADNRAGGVRGGAWPASRYNNPPPKSLIFQAFWAKQRFEYFKTLGGRSGQKSPDRTFLTS
ncbi:MAG: hypothetical protein MSO56_00595, partial [Clostridiales bacterium]|nr:hypothetical protein [Clostridiales bacterium]